MLDPLETPCYRVEVQRYGAFALHNKRNNMPTRIQMRPNANPHPIIGIDGRSLGWFVPGLGYWVTVENRLSVNEVLALGVAVEVSPATAPFPALNVSAASAEVHGSIHIGE
jgi:hypothetical protein